MTKKIVLCILGVAAGASAAAFTQDTVIEMLGYAPETQITEVDDESTEEGFKSAEDLNHAGVAKSSSPSSPSSRNASRSASRNAEKPGPAPEEVSDSKVLEPNPIESSSGTEFEASEFTPEQDVADKPDVAVTARSKDSSTSSKRRLRRPSGQGDAFRNTPKRETVVVAKPAMPGPPAPDELEKNDSPPMHTDSITGVWSVVSAEYGARKLDAELVQEMSLEISKAHLLVRQKDKVEKGRLVIGETFEIDGFTATKIEIFSAKEDASPIKGFYFLEGENLRMVWAAPGQGRPDSFKIVDGSPIRLLELKRSP